MDVVEIPVSEAFVCRSHGNGWYHHLAEKVTSPGLTKLCFCCNSFKNTASVFTCTTFP